MTLRPILTAQLGLNRSAWPEGLCFALSPHLHSPELPSLFRPRMGGLDFCCCESFPSLGRKSLLRLICWIRLDFYCCGVPLLPGTQIIASLDLLVEGGEWASVSSALLEGVSSELFVRVLQSPGRGACSAHKESRPEAAFGGLSCLVALWVTRQLLRLCGLPCGSPARSRIRRRTGRR